MKKYEILTDKGLKKKHHDKISYVEKCFVVLSEKNSGTVLQFTSKDWIYWYVSKRSERFSLAIGSLIGQS